MANPELDEDEVNSNASDGDKEEEEEVKEQVLVDRKVIDEKLIRESVLEDLEAQETGLPMKAEDIDLQEVMELSLSFKNIYAVDNLFGFEQLVKLQLDNNIIENIQNLDHLVNLEWLDLSFNNISKIQNLDKLTNLTDLSLFNNRITTIENLDSLTNLNVLSLGNNMIEDLESVKSLRSFRNLRLLNLTGNPVCDNPDYQNTIFAYLTRLSYLDYVMIEGAQVSKARDSKLDKLLDLEAKEKSAKAQKEEEKKAAERLALMEKANLGGLSTIVDWVVSEDDQYDKLKILPGFQKIMSRYREGADGITSQYIEQILVRHSSKEEEKELFEGVVIKFSTDVEEKSIQKIQAFEALKKKVVREYEETKKPELLEQLKVEVAKLLDELMDTEMMLVETLNDVMDEFESEFAKFVSVNVQAITSCFKELSEVSTRYADQLRKLVHQLLEQMAQADAHADDNADVTALLSDRDALNTAVGSSSDNHTGKIMQRGDEMAEAEDAQAKQYYKDKRQDEYERNRYRVAEIQLLIKTYNQSIDQLFQDQVEDDEYMYGGEYR